jgi:hypothetical protein
VLLPQVLAELTAPGQPGHCCYSEARKCV